MDSKKKYKAFVWLIPVVILFIIYVIVLIHFGKTELAGVELTTPGHKSLLVTAFAGFIMLIPMGIIDTVFIIITVFKYKNLSNENSEIQTNKEVKKEAKKESEKESKKEKKESKKKEEVKEKTAE